MPKITKVTVHAGHNKNGKIACGASDYIDESKEARIICKKVIRLLKRNGVKAYNCTVNNGTSQSDVLKKICRKCNARDRQLDISIHFNAADHSRADGKTKGVEALLYKNDGIKAEIAKRMCEQISRIGFTNRGIKVRTDLSVLKNTTKPAILIEVCFVDDQDDAKLYKANKDAVAKAIAKAILNAA
ncbi:N-acetylmuramoyl-L-alanine amidase [bacterium D16-51]|nr:N-acetylmuramoyl-L-alanine amidase [bacterium D16-59]RKI54062.1 N-acetylmuramoyl-L-alanine amidase [bacterium D16-51]